jgi:diguanylate cyclase (GGDEF)-like protein/PAS domain S-box-containing protein
VAVRDPRAAASDEGRFIVSHDLRFIAVQAAARSPLFPDADAARERSVWAVFDGEMRPAAHAAFKRLLTGEAFVDWEVRDDRRGLYYAIHTERAAEGFVNRFVAVSGRHEGGRETPSRLPEANSIPVTHADDAEAASPPVAAVGPFSASPRAAALLFGTAEAAVSPVLDLAPLPPVTLPERTATVAPRQSQDEEIEPFFLVSPDPLCILDTAGRFEQVNPAWKRALGQDRAALYSASLSEWVHPEERETVCRALDTVVSGEEAVTVVCRYRRTDGVYRWLHLTFAAAVLRGRTRIYGTARDVTESRAAEEAMRRQAYQDTLTGLPNRALLLDRIGYTLAAANRRRNAVGILFVDLDRFKRINDTLGHAAGDSVLREIAERLSDALREEDTVARYGGDEFVVLLPSIRGIQDAQRVAEKLLQRFDHPFDIAGHSVPVTCSIGISLFPEDADTAEALINAADQAMYRAKNAGPGRFARLSPGGAVNALERLTLESRLSQALDREELRLHYQPQVCVSTGRVVGVEALMRWQANELGFVSPSTFIPLAEESGLITRIGAWAVHEACRQAVDWKRAGFPLQMGVNLSAAQLMDTQFPDKLEAYLREVGLPPRQVDLELTESVIMRNEGSARETLERLKELGVHLSVDDFGTKYSSLMYLRNLPIDGVKVDREFVSEIATNPLDEALVRAIIDLSHTLGLKVIAEGVETTEQRDRLLALGCDIMQGHLFSAAVAPGEVTSLLEAGMPGSKRLRALEPRFTKRF